MRAGLTGLRGPEPRWRRSGGASGQGAQERLRITKELRLIHRIFGSPLDTSIVVINEDLPDTKGTAKCQVDAAKAVKRCQDAKIKRRPLRA